MLNFVIEHVRGETNVSGDLLSRWEGAAEETCGTTVSMARINVLMVTCRGSPQEKAIECPSHD
jgi:hypothetical protein